MAEYFVGAKIKKVVVEFRSKKLPIERAIGIYTTLIENPDYTSVVLYRKNGKREIAVPESEIEKILNSEET